MTTDIKKYDFKAGLPQEFEIVDLASTFESQKAILTKTHRTGFYHIIWFQKGSPTHLVDFNPIKIKPNTMLFLNKDVVHRFDSKTKFEGKVILFTDRFFCKTDADTKFLRDNILFNDLFFISQILPKRQSDLFSNLLQQMLEESQNTKDNAQADILKNLLHNFLLHAEREKRKQNFVEIKKDADYDYVMLFKDLLEKNYKTQKQVNDYAKAMIISEKRLNQATSKLFGKTPKAMIDDRIMLEAKRILAHTTESIKGIAYQLGFEEPTNFIKYFKKHANIIPTEFREKHTLA
jgi:AraC-like DNA-binding protein